MAFHSNGTQILTAGADKTAKLWTVATGKLDRTFGPLAEAVSRRRLLARLHLRRRHGGQDAEGVERGRRQGGVSLDMPQPAASLSFNADKTRVATAHSDGKARVVGPGRRRRRRRRSCTPAR